MRIEGAWSTTPFTYFPSSGVRERSTWCRYRLSGDGLSTFLGNIRFVRSRGVTSSRIVELRGETYPSPSLRLLVGALSDRLISRDHTSFRSTWKSKRLLIRGTESKQNMPNLGNTWDKLHGSDESHTTSRTTTERAREPRYCIPLLLLRSDRYRFYCDATHRCLISRVTFFI